MILEKRVDLQSWQAIICYLQLTFQLVLSLFLKRETPVGT